MRLPKGEDEDKDEDCPDESTDLSALDGTDDDLAGFRTRLPNGDEDLASPEAEEDTVGEVSRTPRDDDFRVLPNTVDAAASVAETDTAD